MSESQAKYLDVPVECPKCGVVVGYYKQMPRGETWIEIGSMIMSELHGFHKCQDGTLGEFHFVYTTKRLESLIERIKK